MSNQILLTVSGVIPRDLDAQIARGERPRADYRELARSFAADLIDYTAARTIAGRLAAGLERIGGPDLVLAWACFKLRKRYKVIVTDGEQIGLPLAALLKYAGFGRRPQHLMIVHILSTPKKLFFLDTLGVHSHIDQFWAYATSQQRFIEQRWQLAPERVRFTPFMVDSAFFTLNAAAPTPRERPLICAVGLERRDYPTLLQAVDGVAADVVIAAGSPWSKRSDSTQGRTLPANVTVRKFSQFELRQLYADSRFLVMPLEDVDFQAGVTALLEAAAMERAIICSQISGQTDVVSAGVNGIYVPPGDPAALRSAIEQLLGNPALAEQMGRAGRRLIDEQMSLDHYVERLSGFVREALAAADEHTAPLSASKQA